MKNDKSKNPELEEKMLTFLPTLNIGLGGTGARILLRAKLLIKQMYGEIPPLIKFLSIDTTTSDFSNVDSYGDTSVKFDNSEVLYLSVPGVRELLEANEIVNDFVPDKNKGANLSITNGAGQVRSNGRIALFHHYSRFKEILRTTIESCKANDLTNSKYKKDSKNKLIINVVCSIAGGTGSGMFVDIPFIIRSLNVLQKDDEINAYLILPEVYVSGLKGVEKKRLRPNAYGAIKEIDFLSHKAIEDLLTIKYTQNDNYKINNKPFNKIILIDNKDVNGINIYNEVSAINDFVGSCIYLSSGSAAKDLIDAMDNFKLENQEWIDGRIFPRYSGIGVAEIYYDGDIMSEIYVNKLIKDSLLHNWTNPNSHINIDNSIQDLLKQLVIREEENYDELIKRILSDEVEKYPETPSDFEPEQITQISTDYIRDTKTTTEKIAFEKKDQVLNEVKSALDNYLNTKFFEIGGLDFCEKLLQNLMIKFEFLKNMMEKEASDKEKGFERKIGIIEENLNRILNEIKDTGGLFKKKKRAELWTEYSSDLVDQSRAIKELERRKKASDVYGSLISYLEQDIYPKIKIIKDLIENLNKDAVDRISEIESRNLSSRPFRIEIHKRLIPEVNPERKEIDFDEFVKELNKNNNKNIDILAQMDLVEFKKLIYNFSSNRDEVKDIRNETVENALLKIKHKELQSLINDLTIKAQPLWKYDSGKLINQPMTSYTFAVYNQEDTVFKQEEINSMLNKDTQMAKFISTGDKRRVFLISYSAFIPAYVIDKIQIYKTEYQKQNSTFSYHISKDWEEKAPDIFPGKKELLIWALGFVFKLIKREGSRKYVVYSQKYGDTSNSLLYNLNTSSREEAFESFSDNKKLIEEYKTLILSKINDLGDMKEANSKLSDILKKYTSEEVTFETEEAQNENKELKELLEQEKHMIKNYLKGITKL